MKTYSCEILIVCEVWMWESGNTSAVWPIMILFLRKTLAEWNLWVNSGPNTPKLNLWFPFHYTSLNENSFSMYFYLFWDWTNPLPCYFNVFTKVQTLITAFQEWNLRANQGRCTMCFCFCFFFCFLCNAA